MQRAQPLELDPMRCPLCDARNTCAMEVERSTGQAQGPCWCTRVAFDAGLLARVPRQARGKACVCPACADQAPV